jgi:UDP-N-acetylglucosamine acyltransferase
MAIHKTAIIDARAELGKNNEIGPNVIIEGPVCMGDNNIIDAGAVIKSKTTIGNRNHIHYYAVIGNDPQDVSFDGTDTQTVIGDDNIIREFTTIHRSTSKESATHIGNSNFIMTTAHIGHDCLVGNNNYIVNACLLGGHVHVGNSVFLSGYVGIHQFTHVGSYAIVGGFCRLIKDVPPYMMVQGTPALVHGINVIGLRRNGFSPDRRKLLKKAYVQLYRSGANVKTSLAVLERSMEDAETPEQKADLKMLIDFIKDSKRGIMLRSPKDDSESRGDESE